MVGSGPAGLTAAYYLRLQGHEVTRVSRRCPRPEGCCATASLSTGCPGPCSTARSREIVDAGVQIETGAMVESCDELFDAGLRRRASWLWALTRGRSCASRGAAAKGVLMGTDFLRAVNLGDDVPLGEQGGCAGRAATWPSTAPGWRGVWARKRCASPAWSAGRRCRPAPTRSSRARRRASPSTRPTPPPASSPRTAG